ncbi:cysteine synthase family protein [Parasphingorhabdus sp.]|uniref:PLP-dependent cysteine synthase family protein n=1 Tax=Parasphingorhabdus sp. TaxID=2709688 RepID=UPI0032667B5A
MLEFVGQAQEDKLLSLSALIGNTPTIKILARYEDQEVTIYAKAEMFNLSGSIKDRMALAILQDAFRHGELMPGQTIVEATSGNSGISFAAIGCALDHPVVIFMPDWVSSERRATLEIYGADVRLVSREEGGFLGCMAAAEELGQQGAYMPRQFSNPVNADEHAEGTGPELWQQLATDGGALGGFVAGVGTGGTVMGMGRYLKGRDPSIAVHPVEPMESPTLSVGHKCGQHRVQGLSDEFIPAILDLSQLDDVIGVHDGDAILMAQRLNRQFGLGVGISSGINLVAAIHAAVQQPVAADGTRKAVATIFADGNTKYLSTDLAKVEPCRDCYLTPKIELLDMQTIR